MPDYCPAVDKLLLVVVIVAWTIAAACAAWGFVRAVTGGGVTAGVINAFSCGACALLAGLVPIIFGWFAPADVAAAACLG